MILFPARPCLRVSKRAKDFAVAGVFRYKDHQSINPIMKKSLCLAVSLLALNLTPGFGQSADGDHVFLTVTPTSQQPSALTKFNLDFPGGTPKELVAAIVKAMGKPLNVIISDQDAATQLPPLKLNNVNVSELFNALQSASEKVESYVSPSRLIPYKGAPPIYEHLTTAYGFRTNGTVTDDSIWYFVVTKPTVPPVVPPEKACRFYQLTPYLDSGLTVDDITTAIRSGWDMQGDTADSRPQISFHKETKLLIAVGEPEKLEVIDNVLKALQPRPQNPNRDFQDRLEKIINNSAPATPEPLPPYARPLPGTRALGHPAPMPTNLPAAQPDK
jgi:hypothetical protein